MQEILSYDEWYWAHDSNLDRGPGELYALYSAYVADMTTYMHDTIKGH